MISTLDGCPLPRLWGKRGLFYAGSRVIGTYERVDYERFIGASLDGRHQVAGNRLSELARAVWLLEKGREA